MKKLQIAAAFLIGTMFGIVIQVANEKEMITKAEKKCHDWCDRNSEENSILFCKSQCTEIIARSDCLKFPYPD